LNSAPKGKAASDCDAVRGLSPNEVNNLGASRASHRPAAPEGVRRRVHGQVRCQEAAGDQRQELAASCLSVHQFYLPDCRRSDAALHALSLQSVN